MPTKQEKEILSITAITQRIKYALETNFQYIWVEGEISNFKLHTSGHLYFTLKDEGAQLSAVCWRSRVSTLGFMPEPGMKVFASGSITVYPPRGAYQLEVTSLKPAGLGALQAAFEQLKKKLSEEGLFDQGHKRPIPQFPTSIGIVTSETGAAIKDIISVISRRFSSVELILCPVAVQGVGAAEEIAEGIRMFNRYGKIDVLIVGRGGGSMEDLWAFNEEIVARAIYDSNIPVISAVGHEVDFTIADFVADLRAPTPSAAAELAVPYRSELLDSLRNISYTLNRQVTAIISSSKEHIGNMIASYTFGKPRDMLHTAFQRLDDSERNLTIRSGHLFELTRQKFSTLQYRLLALDHKAALRRGFAIVRKNGLAVQSAAALKKGDDVNIGFHDGEIDARITREKQT
jgi:exodeoxyribonuclease VII large subunit